jgi:hypothetical protein
MSTDDLMKNLQARNAERRATMTQEERDAEDAGRARFRAKMDADRAWWAETVGEVPEGLSAEEQWPLKVRAFDRLGFHDFFTGPGPMDVSTLPPPSAVARNLWGDSRSVRTVETVDPPTDDPAFRVLRDAVVAAGLQGKVRLTMAKTVWSDGRTYRSAKLSITEWSLLPPDCQEAWTTHGRSWRVGVFGPDDRDMLHGIIDGLPSGYSGGDLEGMIKSILYTAGHPLAPHLLAAMQGEGDGVAVWPAWCRHKGGGDRWGTVTYHDIPAFRKRVVHTDDPVALLAEGLVLTWPGTRQKVRIRLDRHDGFDPSNWCTDVCGARILHVEPTTAPVTRSKGSRSFQVFGRGRSQQTDKVPVVEGRTTVALFSWTDPADYTVTITATLGDDGLPVVAWVDGSCT